ncbi:MAG: serine protease [Gemmatimonadota bacterium]
MLRTAYCGLGRSLAVAALLISAHPPIRLSAQEPQDAPTGETAVVFQRFSARVPKIQLLESSTGAKAVTGSGFYVDRDGHLITNYHVVSKLVAHPDRYRADLLDSAGTARPVTVLRVDVIHDLAVLATTPHGDVPLVIAEGLPPQGRRLFSLGHPYELGITIVEGTYNGLMAHALTPRIHLTGALNPGMSGGPTIDAAGRVVGVNVSTAGNEVSFLVPAAAVTHLLSEAAAAQWAPAKDLLADVAEQLRAYSDSYLATMFTGDVPSTTLGGVELPTRAAPFFNCWADADREPSRPWESVEHLCTTDDVVFLSEDLWAGVLEFGHTLFTSDKLSPVRFYAMYQDRFGGDVQWLGGGDEDLTEFRCRTRNVEQGNAKWRTVFCLRAYKRLPGLYDAVFKAAQLGRGNVGVMTRLTLSGVTSKAAEATARRYFARVRWVH